MNYGEYFLKKRLENNLTVLQLVNLAVEYPFFIKPSQVYLFEENLKDLTREFITLIIEAYYSNCQDVELLNVEIANFQPTQKNIISRVKSTIPRHKKTISAIKVPLELNLSSKQWQELVDDFNSKLVSV